MSTHTNITETPSGKADAAWSAPTSFYSRYGKRVADLAVAAAILPALGLVTAGVAAAVAMDDRGPVFFRQERWGQHGKPFRIIKFRSMSVGARDLRNADSSTVASRNDSRVTRVGRVLRATSVDELPQILNVVRGEMSIVGPRPNLATKPVDQMRPDERRRLSVRPGITGYNQAFFRNSTTLDDRYAADCYYVDNLSLRMDLRVVARTLRAVLAREQIYTEENR